LMHRVGWAHAGGRPGALGAGGRAMWGCIMWAGLTPAGAPECCFQRDESCNDVGLRRRAARGAQRWGAGRVGMRNVGWSCVGGRPGAATRGVSHGRRECGMPTMRNAGT